MERSTTPHGSATDDTSARNHTDNPPVETGRAATTDLGARRTHWEMLARQTRTGMLAAAQRVLGPRAQEALDAVQDAWCHHLEHPDSLEGIPVARQVPWLLRSARLAALNRRRRRSLRDEGRVHGDSTLDDHADSTHADDRYDWEQHRAVAQAFRRLPEATRGLLTLAVIDGLSTREVAAVTGIPQSTVKEQLRAARRLLAGQVIHALSAGGRPPR